MRTKRFLYTGLAALLLFASCASVEVRAVRKGDLEAIDKYLAGGGDPNAVDNRGNGLIHIAVQYNRADSLKRLLEAGADANLKNSAGDTAAIMAAEKDHFDMIKLLIKHGGDMRIRGNGKRSTLMFAAAKGDIPLMDLLIKLGVPVNGIDDAGQTALFYSTSASAPDGMNFLFRSGADSSVTDRKGRTPLHLLSRNNQTSMAELLLDKGVDLSIQRNDNGETALHVAAGNASWALVDLYISRGAADQINLLSKNIGAPLFYALNEKLDSAAAVKTMETLLRNGADPNQPSVRNTLPIVQAVEKLDVPRTRTLLFWGAVTDVMLPEDKTLLHIAVERKLPDMVSLLLDQGIDPERKDRYGRTPLYLAVMNSEADIAGILLGKGANPNAYSTGGKNSLYFTFSKDVNGTGYSTMTTLLMQYGAVLPQNRELLNPLVLEASFSGNRNALKLLLDSGADPDYIGKDGQTALMITSSKRFPDLSEILLQHGAKVEKLDNKGNTALHKAAQAGSVAGVELLLQYGANPDPLNYDNIRPIELAPDNEQGAKIVEILLAAGAAPLPVVQPEQPAAEEDKPDAGENITVTGQAEKPAAGDTQTQTETTTVPEPEQPAVTVKDESADESTAVQDDWSKAVVLVRGEAEPRQVSLKRISFSGFSASVPESFPRNLVSRFNKREITLFIRNNSVKPVEVYIVNSDGKLRPVAVIAIGKIFKMDSQQGNIYPVYGSDSRYFGVMKTTGVEKQYFILTDSK